MTTTSEYHTEIAAKHGVRMPRSDSARTTGNQARFLHSIGFTWKELAEVIGPERPGEFFLLNPQATVREWAGVVLEGLEYQGSAPRPRRVYKRAANV